MSIVATTIDTECVLATLRLAWSSRSSSQWLPDNPARGQCNVTAILLHDLHGAEILKTPLAAGEHFYNRIGHERIDLTAAQFDAPIVYADIASSREEAMAGTAEENYAALKDAYVARCGA